MKEKIVSGMMLTLLLASMFTLAFDIEAVKAITTIYIKADGSIEPDTAPISTVDNVTYTFTDNIIFDSIVVERNDIVIDGAGHTLQGTGASQSRGIDLTGRTNVTIRNTQIKNYNFGIVLSSSSGNSISGNGVTGNVFGIVLAGSSGNSISENNVTGNSFTGMELTGSSGNSISENNITSNGFGFRLEYSFNNSIIGNDITGSSTCIYLYYSSNSSISGNNIAENGYEGSGIVLSYYSNHNCVSGNNITASPWFGVWISRSFNNSVCGNNIANSFYGICLTRASNNSVCGNTFTNDGLAVWDSYMNVVEDNTVNGKPLVYLEGVVDYGVGDAGQVILVNCTNIRVQNLNLSQTSIGVQLLHTNNTIVSGNNITDNDYGICLDSSSGNRFYHNNFIDNNQQVSVQSSGYANVWDDGYPSGGNYWSDYAGVDLCSGPSQNETGSDGIGDTAYIIDSENQDSYPLMKSYPWASHDIGITTLTASKTVVGQGYSVPINGMLFNYGNETENFDITVYANSTLLATATIIALASRTSTAITFIWNTAGWAKGNYSISALADTVPGEVDVSDNSLTDGWVIVAMIGDITGPTPNVPDGKVDIRDIALVAKAFGASIITDPTSPRCGQYWHSTPCSTCPHHPNCDITGPVVGVPDGKIDIRDIALIAENFGKAYP